MNYKSRFIPSIDIDRFGGLLSDALSESDEASRWPIIEQLRNLSAETILHEADKSFRRNCTLERSIMADVLGGFENAGAGISTKCVELLKSTIRHEENPSVLLHLLAALSNHSFNDTSDIRALANHPDCEVRRSVTRALVSHKDDQTTATLIQLSRDTDAGVRDWATFGIGTMNDNDTPEIREALYDRLNDLDEDTRSEAIVGLAERRDSRVLEALKQELLSPTFQTIILEAAEKMACPSLLPVLIDLRPYLSEQPDPELESAIAACSPSQKH